MPRSGCSLRRRVFGVALSMALAAGVGDGAAHAAEYGTGPWVKGYTDIFGGILPPQLGLYVRNDAYHYEGEVGATIFDGNVQLGVEERYLADILAVTYVTPWKILGGTYAVAVAPSIVQMNVDVGATISGLTFTGPRDLRTFHIPSLTVSAADHELAQGDTAFAQIEAGTRRVGFGKVNVSSLLAHLGESYTAAAEHEGKSITLNIAPKVTTLGDKALLTEMFSNLLDNALRHTPRGTNIEVSLAESDSNTVAFVADNGPGVPAGDRDLIFRRFYRLARSAKTPGHGLGLSIAAAVADLHGITLSAEDNKPGLRIRVSFGAP